MRIDKALTAHVTVGKPRWMDTSRGWGGESRGISNHVTNRRLVGFLKTTRAQIPTHLSQEGQDECAPTSYDTVPGARARTRTLRLGRANGGGIGVIT